MTPKTDGESFHGFLRLSVRGDLHGSFSGVKPGGGWGAGRGAGAQIRDSSRGIGIVRGWTPVRGPELWKVYSVVGFRFPFCLLGGGRRWKVWDSSAWQRRMRPPACGSPTPFGTGRGRCGATRPPVVVDHDGGRERRPEAVLGETEFTDDDDAGVARGHNGPVPPVAGDIGSPTR